MLLFSDCAFPSDAINVMMIIKLKKRRRMEGCLQVIECKIQSQIIVSNRCMYECILFSRCLNPIVMTRFPIPSNQQSGCENDDEADVARKKTSVVVNRKSRCLKSLMLPL